MRRILIGLTASALSVVGLMGSAGTASAHESRGHAARAHAYYHDHGRRFSGGYYYVGRDHPHWGRCVWDVTCHRYNYWDPYLGIWYYWYAPGGCWYPVTYCP